MDTEATGRDAASAGARGGSSGNRKSKKPGLVERLKILHQLLTDRFSNHAEHRDAYLQAGLGMFAAQIGMLLRVRLLQPTAEVDAVAGMDLAGEVEVDQTLEWCSAPIAHRTTTLWNCPEPNVSREVYNGVEIRGYLCTPVFVAGHIYGLLCFLQSAGGQGGFTDEDAETVEIMAKGVAKMIELQRVPPVDQARLRAGFVTEGVKTFEEYIYQARLPEVYGVPGRVVEVLQKRIGKASLSIDFIAEEMNLSKRTLQRRLQQQGISFAELRDQVRFHYSINYLVENNMSIDSISSTLDFSDRTSFTNAFKRWTGLSPSTFRKLFRDYA